MAIDRDADDGRAILALFARRRANVAIGDVDALDLDDGGRTLTVNCRDRATAVWTGYRLERRGLGPLNGVVRAHVATKA